MLSTSGNRYAITKKYPLTKADSDEINNVLSGAMLLNMKTVQIETDRGFHTIHVFNLSTDEKEMLMTVRPSGVELAVWERAAGYVPGKVYGVPVH